jgi:Ca2+-binding RTX toxin-like protein
MVRTWSRPWLEQLEDRRVLDASALPLDPLTPTTEPVAVAPTADATTSTLLTAPEAVAVPAEITLYGEDGDDPPPIATGDGITLYGEGGDDSLAPATEVTLYGEDGDNPPVIATGEGITLFGGEGSDPLFTGTVVPLLSGDAVLTEPVVETTNQVSAPATVSTNPDEVLVGGAGDDLLIGSAGQDVLVGGIVATQA